MAYLEINNLTKSYGGEEVLKGITFSAEKGEVISVIGSSGSGKTTLLRCINFLETPDNGSMVLDGKTLVSEENGKKTTEKELREKRLNFGLVFQSFNLFPQYSVIKNVMLAPELLLKEELTAKKKELKSGGIKGKDARRELSDFKKARKAEIQKEAEELIEKVGLTEKSAAYPCELSGGQQQRVAIARALALKPKVLCFDEPTSALDPELTGEVLKVIKSLKEKDRTMIIVTHEIGFAKNVSDKIVFMSDGVIEEEGEAKSVIDNPRSEKLKAFLSGIKEKENII